MRSRFLIELTTPEVEKYFSDGGKTAVLPVGSVEMHGPHQPICTDTFIAKAFSLQLARSTNGIVLPEVSFTWAGSTDGFAGTISVDIELQQKIVEAVIIKAAKMEFKRFVVVSVHAPNKSILFLSTRRIFENTHIPVLFVDPYRPFSESNGKIFEGDYEDSKEASLVLGALQILGMPNLYSESEMSYEEHAPSFPDSLKRLWSVGVVGYFMQDPRQHACPTKYVSLEKGVDFINKQEEFLVPFMDDIDKYAKEVVGQKNKGWWK